jgi:regulator of ribonuclease activity A
MMTTADLYDELGERLKVAAPVFRDYGGRTSFEGPLATVKVFEDNSLVRTALSEAGAGRVLVVDGGGSLRCALLGDQLGKLASTNGWVGVVVWGCVRDVEALAELPLGVKALASSPRRSAKLGVGSRDLAVRFAEVEFLPGEYLVADRDGVVVSPTRP